MKNTYEGSLNMATLFEKKLAEAEVALAKLIAAESEVAAQIEDTSRQILAMRRVIATLRPGLEERPEEKPTMPPADIPQFLAAARAVDRNEYAERNFLTPEEAEIAMAQAERMHDEALGQVKE